MIADNSARSYRMPRLANGQLSYVSGKGFRASVGYYLKDGNRTPKVCWLGHDPVNAHYFAYQARGNWQAITFSGGDHWTDDEVQELREAVAIFVRSRQQIFSQHAKFLKQAETKVQELR